MARRGAIPLEKARNRMAAFWFSGSGAIFCLLVAQSILGKYHGHLQQVWSWFIPTVVPTLALIIGVVGATSLSHDRDVRKVRLPFFRLARGLTFVYLLTLAATILLEPLSPTPGVELLMLSNYWLTPIQGLVVGATGVLFAAQERPGGNDEPARR